MKHVDAHEGFGRGAGLAADVEVGLIVNQLGKAFAGNRVVFDEEDAVFSGE